ncbi:conserved protein, unknown function [Hepatocystis sp. ex Piliocolobus tephrosceles]|nr:conserved protein, unknown function [Hepatocystis sp. ex Piliocolobus tephrosceles]
MSGDKALIANFNILDTVCSKLSEILQNVEDVLHRLSPLNNDEELDDSLFIDLKEEKNEVIALSNVIYNNIGQLRTMLYDFIKSLPPCYTYYNTFHYTDFLILKEKKKKLPKELQLEQILDVKQTEDVEQQDKEKQKLNLINKQYDNISYSTQSDTKNITDINKEQDEQDEEEFFYSSSLINLEYSNLLYMQKCEKQINQYLISYRS